MDQYSHCIAHPILLCYCFKNDKIAHDHLILSMRVSVLNVDSRIDNYLQ